MAPFVLVPPSEGNPDLLWTGVLSDSTTTPCSWFGGMSLLLNDFTPALFPGSMLSRLSVSVLDDLDCEIDVVNEAVE